MKTPQFEQRLAALYDTAKKGKEAAKAQLQAAELACEHAEDQETAERMKVEAKRAYTAALTDADAMLNAARSSLRAELAEDVRKRSLADPDAVVPAALTLLGSGVLTSGDMAAMADRYRENPTMLRLIVPYVRRAMCAASGARDHAEHDALERVIDACQGYLNADLTAFDKLDEKLSGEMNS